ncbi:RNHCP domain-containing protein [Streptomyces boluensis]|uniref:RNHCP domain-containing protein n=1 Tax=Streptomyces boluensis TaxID=1775135 RepID=A0A964XRL8_9ACTN|nr:RNHCP domain-containing protein [Streptomyces boluensis]NBE56933.1 RNHCP domain-containing protein [Streptomyces boluensis]
MPRRRTRPPQTRRQRRKDVLHTQGGHRSNDFRCVGCRLDVPASAPGTAHRNHCPNCLTSRHLDHRIPGDRASPCHGRMEPLSLSVRPDGEWLIIHQCVSCEKLSANRTAADDNPRALLNLALRPLRAGAMTSKKLDVRDR